MPDVLEVPRNLPARLAPFCFTEESARRAGQRSAEVRRERYGTAKPAQGPPKPELSAAENAVNAQLELVSEQIAHTRSVLNDTRTHYCPACERSGIEPHHRAQLLKALDALLDRQRNLLGVAFPANVKQIAAKPKVMATPSPVGIATPAQASTAACGSDART